MENSRKRSTFRPTSHGRGIPYDDGEYESRWLLMSEAELNAAAERDPLLFVADHLPSTQRGDRRIAVLMVAPDDGQKVVATIADWPHDWTLDEARSTLDTFARTDHVANARMSLGVIVHRRGPATITPTDLMWNDALRDVARTHGLTAIGVLTRTSSGRIVRIHDVRAA